MAQDQILIPRSVISCSCKVRFATQGNIFTVVDDEDVDTFGAIIHPAQEVTETGVVQEVK